MSNNSTTNQSTGTAPSRYTDGQTAFAIITLTAGMITIAFLIRSTYDTAMNELVEAEQFGFRWSEVPLADNTPTLGFMLIGAMIAGLVYLFTQLLIQVRALVS